MVWVLEKPVMCFQNTDINQRAVGLWVVEIGNEHKTLVRVSH